MFSPSLLVNSQIVPQTSPKPNLYSHHSSLFVLLLDALQSGQPLASLNKRNAEIQQVSLYFIVTTAHT